MLTTIALIILIALQLVWSVPLLSFAAIAPFVECNDPRGEWCPGAMDFVGYWLLGEILLAPPTFLVALLKFARPVSNTHD